MLAKKLTRLQNIMLHCNNGGNMSTNFNSFGEFLHTKRLEKHMTYRELAAALGVTAPYLSDVEKGRRNAPPMDRLEAISKILILSDKEKIEMFDLAGKDKDTVAPDIPEYIIENDYVAAALRTAKSLGANEKDWQDFVEDLKKKNG